MGEVSGIAWTDATFNPWWGCVRVSPGCEHCYAETLATTRRQLKVWGVDAERKPMSDAYWREPVKWNRKAEAEKVRKRVFCASMADVFEMPPKRNIQARDVQTAARERLWHLIMATPWLDWLLLTKRPENVAGVAPWLNGWGAWPENVWLGVTAEDQKRADERIPILLNIPAKVRFVSHEPALESVDFSPWLQRTISEPCHFIPFSEEAKQLYGDEGPRVLTRTMPGVDWIITGGESGPNARPYDPKWARSVIDECRAAGAAPFVKQLGANPVGLELRDRKGGDLSEWPADLRVQEFPRTADVKGDVK